LESGHKIKICLQNNSETLYYLGKIGYSPGIVKFFSIGAPFMSNIATILVVDDDEDFRTANRLILEKAGYSVLEAADATAGSVLTEKHNPDLILLDVMMEEVDSGFTFAEKYGHEYKIILISSIADSSVKVFEVDNLPVFDIIQKPLTPEVLVKKVKTAIE
jgi:DNA-binding response OmpR family regulator